MFTRPRFRFTVAEAEAVAITEIRLAAIAARMGTPRTSVRMGTRKTPPPRPSSAPTSPVQAPVRIRSPAGTAGTRAIVSPRPTAPGRISRASGPRGRRRAASSPWARSCCCPAWSSCGRRGPRCRSCPRPSGSSPGGGDCRGSAFLRGALIAFVLLALLRAAPAARLRSARAGPRCSWPRPRPRGSLPYAAWPVAPGADMSLHSLSAAAARLARRDTPDVRAAPAHPRLRRLHARAARAGRGRRAALGPCPPTGRRSWCPPPPTGS